MVISLLFTLIRGYCNPMTALLSPRPHTEKRGIWRKGRGRGEGERNRKKDILANNIRGDEGEGDDTFVCAICELEK